MKRTLKVVVSILGIMAFLAGCKTMPPGVARPEIPSPGNAAGILTIGRGKGAVVPEFRIIDSMVPPQERTKVSVETYADGLRIVFHCEDRAVLAQQEGRDSSKLWKDDSVYVWIDPGHTHAFSNVFMVQVTAGGVVNDARGVDPKFNVEGLVTAVTNTAGGWQADVRIPWSGLNVPAPRPADVWGLNLMRADYPGAYDFDTMRQSAWVPIPGGIVLNPRKWGHLIFADDATWVSDVAFARAGLEKLHQAISPDAVPPAEEAARVGQAVPRYYEGGSMSGEPVRMAIPPWPSQYKIRAGETNRMTPADVPGPDGIVYPNWQNVGVQGGIPDVPVVLELKDLGAKPKTNISGMLALACEQVAAKGGGAIRIDPGTFYLNDPVVIRHSGVVIRGAGRERTRLVFRYSIVHTEAQFPKTWPEASVFTWSGNMAPDGQDRLLAEDGKRGDTRLTLRDASGIGRGDKFYIRAPSTPRWEALTGHKESIGWGVRINAYEVKAVEGSTLVLSQPLRIDFPVVDGSYIRLIQPVERCGIEDLTIEHMCRMPFHTVNSHWAWNCWARRVNVIQSGCSAIHLQEAKWCEVRDCEFDGFDFRIHKANVNWGAYGGFTCSWDCLMENVVCRRFRHAPQVQFGAQGNVIRNSVFEGSDAQWHAGWSTENLFENCRVGPTGPYGSYGYGMYSTPSMDETHGPNGPRNVVYNCDVESDKAGVYARGVSENWLFLHNRFVVKDGVGFYADGGFFDAILRNNVFVLGGTHLPMLFLRTPDCVGFELVGNVVYGGNGRIVDGVADVLVNKENRARPAPPGGLPARPTANPRSIYEWQTNGQGQRCRIATEID